MKIHDARLTAQTLTLRTSLRTARGECRTREGWVLTLRADGLRGQGEATPHPFCDGTEFTRCFGELTQAVQALTGTRLPDDVQAVEELARNIVSAAPARHAVESALLDLLAQAKGVSVAKLLCAQPCASVPVNALLVEDAPGALFEEARRAVAQGFGTLKVKVGLGDDDARLTAVREGAGGGVKLRVDANGAWSAAEARLALGRLRRFGLELCEQPVPRDDVGGLRALREEGLCRIAADESLGTERDLVALLPPDGQGAPAVDVLVLRPMMLGGLLPSLRRGRAGRARGVASYVASGLDGVVARAAAVQLALRFPFPLERARVRGRSPTGRASRRCSRPTTPQEIPTPCMKGQILLPTSNGLGLPEVR